MALTHQQALDVLGSDDLIGLGMEADATRRQLHPERVVTYVIEGTVAADAPETTIALETGRAERLGCTGFQILPAATPAAIPAGSSNGVPAMMRLLHRLKQSHTGSETPTLRGLDATAVLGLAQAAGTGTHDILLALRDAGLQALGGGDAYLLDDGLRQRAERPLCDSAAWLRVHREAHVLGLASDASITFGVGEDADTRVRHLLALRTLQEETGGFFAFTANAFAPAHPTPSHRALDEPTAVEYLKTLALARILLANISNMQAAGAQGLKVVQMALRFGANDAGAVLLDEAAIRKAGPSNCATEEELRRIIRDAGFAPVARDGLYRSCMLT